VSFGGVAALFLGYSLWGTSEMFFYLLTTIMNLVVEKIAKR
jgi:hypothetical protein